MYEAACGGLSGVPDGEASLSGVPNAEVRLSGVSCAEERLSGVPNPEAAASTHPLAPSTRRVLHYPDRNALLRALAAERGELLPEGGTILIKASHDCGFADILAYLQELD